MRIGNRLKRRQRSRRTAPNVNDATHCNAQTLGPPAAVSILPRNRFLESLDLLPDDFRGKKQHRFVLLARHLHRRTEGAWSPTRSAVVGQFPIAIPQAGKRVRECARIVSRLDIARQLSEQNAIPFEEHIQELCKLIIGGAVE
jgi:hypothetical protein